MRTTYMTDACNPFDPSIKIGNQGVALSSTKNILRFGYRANYSDMRKKLIMPTHQNPDSNLQIKIQFFENQNYNQLQNNEHENLNHAFENRG